MAEEGVAFREEGGIQAVSCSQQLEAEGALEGGQGGGQTEMVEEVAEEVEAWTGAPDSHTGTLVTVVVGI